MGTELFKNIISSSFLSEFGHIVDSKSIIMHVSKLTWHFNNNINQFLMGSSYLKI